MRKTAIVLSCLLYTAPVLAEGLVPTPWGWRAAPCCRDRGLPGFQGKPPDEMLWGVLAPIFYGEILPRLHQYLPPPPQAHYGPPNGRYGPSYAIHPYLRGGRPPYPPPGPPPIGPGGYGYPPPAYGGLPIPYQGGQPYGPGGPAGPIPSLPPETHQEPSYEVPPPVVEAPMATPDEREAFRRREEAGRAWCQEPRNAGTPMCRNRHGRTQR